MQRFGRLFCFNHKMKYSNLNTTLLGRPDEADLHPWTNSWLSKKVTSGCSLMLCICFTSWLSDSKFLSLYRPDANTMSCLSFCIQEANTFRSEETWQNFWTRPESCYDINYSQSVTASVWLMYYTAVIQKSWSVRILAVFFSTSWAKMFCLKCCKNNLCLIP